MKLAADNCLFASFSRPMRLMRFTHSGRLTGSLSVANCNLFSLWYVSELRSDKNADLYWNLIVVSAFYQMREAQHASPLKNVATTIDCCVLRSLTLLTRACILLSRTLPVWACICSGASVCLRPFPCCTFVIKMLLLSRLQTKWLRIRVDVLFRPLEIWRSENSGDTDQYYFLAPNDGKEGFALLPAIHARWSQGALICIESRRCVFTFDPVNHLMKRTFSN